MVLSGGHQGSKGCMICTAACGTPGDGGVAADFIAIGQGQRRFTDRITGFGQNKIVTIPMILPLHPHAARGKNIAAEQQVCVTLLVLLYCPVVLVIHPQVENSPARAQTTDCRGGIWPKLNTCGGSRVCCSDGNRVINGNLVAIRQDRYQNLRLPNWPRG